MKVTLKNNKGHGGPVFPDWFIYTLAAISYIVLFAMCYCIISVIVVFFKLNISIAKMAFSASIAIPTYYWIKSLIKAWHWRHFGFYTSYKETAIRFAKAGNDGIQLQDNGDIYMEGKPFLTRDKWYGWKVILKDESK